MKIHVLIVDDAVIVRNRVSKILSTVDDIEVVGVAASGKIALLKIPQLNPDVVILDVNMPDMDGLETLAAIRAMYPKLPVIMFSALTVLGATTTLDALILGANDYATKPSNLGSIEAADQHILAELVPKIKALLSAESIESAESKVLSAESIESNNIPNSTEVFPLSPSTNSSLPTTHHPPLTTHHSPPTTHHPPLTTHHSPPTTHHSPLNTIDIVAIGVSTGGPNALAEILSHLPADFPAPILIVQHMPPMFTKLLAERLAAKSQIPVAEAISGTIVKPGHAWIAPGNFHLIVERVGNAVKLVTNQAPPENSCRPAVDVLFRSVAKVYGNKSLGVVLTGMGKDGLQGAEQIRACGGRIFVQDQDSSVVWGMPGFIANAGLAESILPIYQMAGAILQLVRNN